jgi:superfamily II RNA helicase
MATMFIQQSEEYVRQIEAEIERLQQLRDQVQTTIQGEEAEVKAPRKRAMKKSAGKKATATKAPAKRGRPKSNPTVEA